MNDNGTCIATSLDGFIARRDHQIDWLTKQDTEGDDLGFEAFMASVDGIVMGRGSYENVLTFGEWPYKKPVIVMSKRLSDDDIPKRLQGRIRMVDLGPAEMIKSLAAEGWSRAYVDGGKIVQSFIRCGLIEDLVLTTIPILLGDGLRLFGEIGGDIDLELIDSKSFGSGLVQTHYRL
jgi:dihydrofolate reductase